MQIKLVAPKQLRNEIILPASKSISNRVLIINALAHSDKRPLNVSDCDDTRVMVKALTEQTELVDIMAAGTAMRFLTAYFSATEGQRTLTGTERMKQRPIGILVNALKEIGARIDYTEKDGFPPLRISGTQLSGGKLVLPGNISSQYISALLMIAPTLEKGLELELTGEIISRPYINLTLHIMQEFGARVSWADERHVCVLPHPYQPKTYYIENDWSAASYWYQMLSLSDDNAGSIKLPGLFSNSAQGDSAVKELFENLGVHTSFVCDEDGMECAVLTKQKVKVSKMEYNFINQPDLAQTFAVTCCMLNIPFHFYGLQSLKIKETDRIYALIKELGKLGFVIQETNDSELFWDGSRMPIQENASIDTYEDHRMAMAFAPCCLKMPEIRINHPHVVSKSYPSYWEHLSHIGFNITECS